MKFENVNYLIYNKTRSLLCTGIRCWINIKVLEYKVTKVHANQYLLHYV